MEQKPAINIGGLDNLVRYFGTPGEAAELHALRQQASRAAELEQGHAAEPQPAGISAITAFALGVAVGQAGAEQKTTVLQDAKKASRETAGKQPQAQRPVGQAMRPQP